VYSVSHDRWASYLKTNEVLLNCLLLHTWPCFLPLPVLPLCPYLLYSSPNGPTANVNSWVVLPTTLPTLYLCLLLHHGFMAQALHHLHPSPLDNWVNNAAANTNAYIALKVPLLSHDLLPPPLPSLSPAPHFLSPPLRSTSPLPRPTLSPSSLLSP